MGRFQDAVSSRRRRRKRKPPSHRVEERASNARVRRAETLAQSIGVQRVEDRAVRLLLLEPSRERSRPPAERPEPRRDAARGPAARKVRRVRVVVGFAVGFFLSVRRRRAQILQRIFRSAHSRGDVGNPFRIILRDRVVVRITRHLAKLLDNSGGDATSDDVFEGARPSTDFFVFSLHADGIRRRGDDNVGRGVRIAEPAFEALFRVFAPCVRNGFGSKTASLGGVDGDDGDGGAVAAPLGRLASDARRGAFERARLGSLVRRRAHHHEHVAFARGVHAAHLHVFPVAILGNRHVVVVVPAQRRRLRFRRSRACSCAVDGVDDGANERALGERGVARVGHEHGFGGRLVPRCGVARVPRGAYRRDSRLQPRAERGHARAIPLELAVNSARGFLGSLESLLLRDRLRLPRLRGGLPLGLVQGHLALEPRVRGGRLGRRGGHVRVRHRAARNARTRHHDDDERRLF